MPKNNTLTIGIGRGNTGKTTGLNACIELAHRDGREPVLLDASRNPSLSALYPELADKPESHAVSDIKEAITSTFDVMLDMDQSAVIDLGGGQDDTIAEYLLDLNLAEYCAGQGVKPVFFVTLGPNMDDFEHILEIKKRGILEGCNILLVQNEGILKRNQDAAKAFSAIEARPEYQRWVSEEGARPLYLPTLGVLPDVRTLGLSLNDAAANKASRSGEKLGRTKAWMVNRWLEDWDKQFTQFNCVDWKV